MIKRFSQWWLAIAAIALLLAIFFINRAAVEEQANRPMPERKEMIQRPNVSIINVTGQTYAAQVSGYGELEPHFSLNLSAQVNGQITAISDQFETGNTIKKGQWLVKLEQSDYHAALKEAENDVAEAKLALLEEQRHGIQAKLEWQASSLQGQPDSELVLRAPQLAVANAKLDFAKSALARAKKDLRQTHITAPFNALITQRHVSAGSYIQTGSDVASLYSTDRLEVAVPLSNQDWANLPALKEMAQSADVFIKNVEDQQIWQGRVLRAEQNVDTDTRQRALIIGLDKPLEQMPAAFAGTFVHVSLQGRKVDNIWKLPSSALSPRGEIWYVTAENTLDKIVGKPLFSRDNSIFISVPETMIGTSFPVLTHPLNSYIKGMHVTPIEDAH